MIYATSAGEIEISRRAFIRKWRLKCKAVADSLEQAGDRLFTFTRLPVGQWKSARTTDEIDKPFFLVCPRVILQPLMAVEGTVARGLLNAALSTPTAAEGGGRRPAFTKLHCSSDNRPWRSRAALFKNSADCAPPRRRQFVGVVLSPYTGDRMAKSKSEDESLAAQP